MLPDVTTYTNAARDYVNEFLLTDTCQIYSVVYVNDGAGSNIETQGAYRTYHSSTTIPCRLDQTRQFRESNVFLEETTPTNYYISLPYDVTIQADDRIVHGGITYEIRQLFDDSTWKAVKKALVVSTR